MVGWFVVDWSVLKKFVERTTIVFGRLETNWVGVIIIKCASRFARNNFHAY